MDTISYLLGKKAGGGTPTILEEKDVTVTSNGESTINPSEGYNGISKVNLTTNVPQPSGKITITQNGTDIDVSSYATADVSVSGQKYAPRIIKFTNYTGTELNYEISNLDTSNVTTMQNMFNNCSSLTTLDLSNFDTSNVTDMQSMFSSCSSLTTLDLSNFDTLDVTTMQNMFNNCSSLTTLDLSNFNTPLLTNTYQMFNKCTSLTKIDMRNFDFTNVTNYTGMFGTTSQTTWVSSNCLIIVKDTASKQWLNTNFSRLTNVKTVAEYEGS